MFSNKNQAVFRVQCWLRFYCSKYTQQNLTGLWKATELASEKHLHLYSLLIRPQFLRIRWFPVLLDTVVSTFGDSVLFLCQWNSHHKFIWHYPKRALLIRTVFFLFFLFFADDGRLKYKINFGDKGKSLVSGHHIAFDCMPKLDQLFVGARVVVKCKDKMPQFCPGIVAELPSRKNHSRFVRKKDNFLWWSRIKMFLPLFLYKMQLP